MAEKQGSVRTTISLPGDLKARMDRIKEPVNWSALACRAFEDKLAEFAARKERKVMNDVVERLRGSLRKEQGVSFNEGHETGRTWAEDTATAAELTRLQHFHDRTKSKSHLYWGSDDWPDNPRFIALAGEIQNNKNMFPETANAFWKSSLGEMIGQVNDGNFLRGFVEGAVDVWLKVKPQL